jgi:DNA-3-methyladenine glycosylase II
MTVSSSIAHLQQDPVMAELINNHHLPQLSPSTDGAAIFQFLFESIISQQLSVKVADVITARVYGLLPDGLATPQAILGLDQEQIRDCGVSYAKIRYIRSAADAAVSGLVDYQNLLNQSDEAVIAELTQIVGVGRWTAEMLLIFGLGRPDVFSVGDLGLRNAVAKLYGLDRDDRSGIAQFAEQWSPYRSLASRYLWASLNNTTVIQKAKVKS